MRTLIIGSGSTLYADLIESERWHYDVRIGINRAAIDFGPVDWHVTMHPREYGPRKVAPMVSFHPFSGVDLAFPWRWSDNVTSSGSSGLYAVKFALQHLQADEVHLAGVPMDSGPHYDGGDPWPAGLRFRRTWEIVAPELRDRVYSFSGWTRELLGGPQL